MSKPHAPRGRLDRTEAHRDDPVRDHPDRDAVGPDDGTRTDGPLEARHGASLRPCGERPRDLGVRGEALAARFLEARGWRVLARNYRSGRKEVDLITERDGVVAFVEVKSRRGAGFGHPLEAITWKKRREIAHVARAWRAAHPRTGRVLRFDAVAVTFRAGGRPVVEHVPDAWRLP